MGSADKSEVIRFLLVSTRVPGNMAKDLHGSKDMLMMDNSSNKVSGKLLINCNINSKLNPYPNL